MKVWDPLSSSTGKEQTPREMCLPSVKDAILGRMMRNAVETSRVSAEGSPMPKLGNHSEFQNFSESQDTSQHTSTGGSEVTWSHSHRIWWIPMDCNAIFDVKHRKWENLAYL